MHNVLTSDLYRVKLLSTTGLDWFYKRYNTKTNKASRLRGFNHKGIRQAFGELQINRDTNTAVSGSPVTHGIAARVAKDVACLALAPEHSATAKEKLFPYTQNVAMNGTQLRKNIEYLISHLWNQSPKRQDVDVLVALHKDIKASVGGSLERFDADCKIKTNDTAAWVLVLELMLSDYRFYHQ